MNYMKISMMKKSMKMKKKNKLENKKWKVKILYNQVMKINLMKNKMNLKKIQNMMFLMNKEIQL